MLEADSPQTPGHPRLLLPCRSSLAEPALTPAAQIRVAEEPQPEGGRTINTRTKLSVDSK